MSTKDTTPYQPQAQRGTALLMALFMVMLIALLVPPVLRRAVFQHANAFRDSNFITTLHVAEAGVEDALWHLSYDKEKTWEGWNSSRSELYTKPRSQILDAHGHQVAEYEVEIEEPIPMGESIRLGPGSLPFTLTAESEPVITSTAGVPNLDWVGSEIRRVRITARARTVFSLGLFSDKDLNLSGTTLVNSYNSTFGPYSTSKNMFENGDAGSNNDIVMSGTPKVSGDVAAGGSIVMNGQNAEITGAVEGGMTRIDLPSLTAYVDAAKQTNDNAGIPKAVKSNGQEISVYNANTKSLDIQAGATLDLPGGPDKGHPKIYYFSGASLSGNASLNVTGHVLIFTDGSLDLSGGTITNNAGTGSPEKFQVYSSGSSTSEIKINGGSGFAGTIYAPSGQITFTGGGDIYGAAVGGKVNVGGNAQFHYDEALGETGLIAYFEVGKWVEKASPTGV